MKENLVYCVYQHIYYEGSNVFGIFSTLEKAKEYYDTLEPQKGEEFQILAWKVDDPEYIYPDSLPLKYG